MQRKLQAIFPEVIRKHTEGCTNKAIADHYGRDDCTVGKWIKRWKRGDYTAYGFPPPQKEGK